MSDSGRALTGPGGIVARIGAEKSLGLRTGAEVEKGVEILYPSLQVGIEFFAINVLDGALVHVGRSHGEGLRGGSKG